MTKSHSTRGPGPLRPVRVAVFAMVAALASGCMSPGDDDQPQQISTLSGTITGTILDSNGAPISGAVVRYTGASVAKSTVEATTNASGQFELPGVVVTGISSAGVNDSNGPLTLVIDPPQTPVAYAGATVQVSPQAQAIATPGDELIFVDDFNVDTGPVKLPALTTTVRGIVRDAQTGQGLADQAVSLDFEGVEFDQDGLTTGVATTYNSGNIRTQTTAADGSFAFTSVFDDSCVRLNIASRAILSVTGSVPACTTQSDELNDAGARYIATLSEGTVLDLGSVNVQVGSSDDTFGPFVSEVDGVVDPAASPAPLAERITGDAGAPLVVDFSEPIAELTAADVVVVVGESPDQSLATVTSASVSGSRLTVTLDAALPASTAVELRIARDALRDTAGNGATLTDDIAYDSFSGDGQFFVLSFVTFGGTDVTAPVVASVDGVADASGNPATLGAGITGRPDAPLTLRFSEPMEDDVVPGDVSVTLGSGATATVQTVAFVDASTLEIVLAEAVPTNTSVTITILRNALVDAAGNGIALSDNLAYDGFTGGSNQFFTLFLATTGAADQTPPTVAGVTGVIDPAINPATLDASVTGRPGGPLEVIFSEAMQDIVVPGDVTVALGSGPNAVVETVEFTSSTTLAITLANALPLDTTVTVSIGRDALLDEAGNGIALSDGLAYDGFTGDSNQLFTLFLATSGSADQTPPTVAGVTGVIDPAVNPATLDASVTGRPGGPLEVIFSEAMQDIVVPGDVTVALGSGPNAVVETVEFTSSTTLAITLANALPLDTTVTVSIGRDALLDEAGNGIALSDGLAYDGFTGGAAQRFTLFLSTGDAPDTTPPVVASVDGVFDPTVSPAPLESRIDGVAPNGFELRFSETLQDLVSPADVAVLIGEPPNQTSATVDDAVLSGGNLLTVTTVDPLPQGVDVQLFIAREALLDTAGNVVALSGDIAYDSFSDDSAFLVLALRTFSPVDPDAEAPVIVGQVDTPVDPDDIAFVTTAALLDTVQPSTEDIRPALNPDGTGVSYAAAVGDDDVLEQSNNPEAADALNTLLDAIDDGGTRTVRVDVARFTVESSPDAADYVAGLTRNGAPLDVLFFPVFVGDGNPQLTAVADASDFEYVIEDGGASSFDLIVASRPGGDTVQPGDLLQLTARADNGIAGGSVQMTLLDNAHATTSLQLLNLLIAGATGAPTGAAGGVVMEGSATEAATVVLAVTPQAADVNDTEDGFASDDWKGADELQGLSDPSLASFAGVTGTTAAIGDADGTAAFVQVAPRLGIGITEPGVATGSSPTVTGSAVSLSEFGVFNGLEDEDGGTSDVFATRVDDVFTLAADARVGDVTIDLTGAVRDLTGGNVSVAADRAIVAVRDLMPPLMSLAYFDGTDFFFTFNEPVLSQGQIVLNNCDTAGVGQAAITIDLATQAIRQSDTTFSVPATVVTNQQGGGDTVEECFGLGTYDEDAYDGLGLATGAVPHGAISYAAVPDTADNPGTGNNSWQSWAANGLGIGAPFFAMADLRP